MARAKKQVLVEIYDDLDPKSVVAWYDQTTGITYGDADGNTPAEPYDLFPIRDAETDEWRMKELWTTEENHKKVFGPLTKRLADADDAGDWIVIEKSELDKLRDEIEELRRRPAASSSGGSKERRKYGTGPARKDTANVRVWLHAHGFDVKTGGRLPLDQENAFKEANPSGEYEPTEAEMKAWEAYKAEKDGTEPPKEALPFEDSRSEQEALSRVKASGGAPEAEEDAEEEDADYTDEEIAAALDEAGIKHAKNLTDANRLKGIKLLVEAGAAA